MLRATLSVALVLTYALPRPAAGPGAPPEVSSLPRIRFHDNRVPAGRQIAGTLRLTLRARLGRWYPDGDRRPGPIVLAGFAADTGAPMIPGPLVRVRAGTRIHARIVNDLPSGTPLVLHGLETRPAASDHPVHVASGHAREVEFDAGEPGTYYYWAATSDTATIQDREGTDSQLSGALVVDPADGPVPPDRIFLLGVFFQSKAGPSDSDLFAVAINGRSWPLTERFDLTVGDTVRWRWVNPTVDNHPMHLHGFYFRVDAKGSGAADTSYAPERRRQVVTERLDPGATMAMTWSPSTPGQWLMHCHIHAHAFNDALTAPRSGLSSQSPAHGSPMDDMAGLVLGIRVRPAASTQLVPADAAMRHRVRLVVAPSVLRPDGSHVRVSLGDPTDSVPDVGTAAPALILTRGQPAEVTVVNLLDEPTAIHWHGIELESYYDGVPGWSGGSERLAPMIAPGDSFVALMTPPRAGTFIYHAHNMETLQVGDGLAGPLIVLEPGERFDTTSEIVWIVGGHDVGDTGFLRLNGTRWPGPVTVQSGRSYRVRVINITENNTGDVALLAGDTPVEWTPTAKDAAPLPADRRKLGPARVRTSVGETYDFEWTPAQAGRLRFEVRNGGVFMVDQQVEVR